MTEIISINVENKIVSAKERAKARGELTSEVIVAKALDKGYDSLLPFELDFYKELVAEVFQKDLIDVTELDILEKYQLDKIKYFKNLCDEKIEEGFWSTNGHFYRTNRDDQTNMIGQKDDMTGEPDEIIYWKTEDMGYIPHSRDEWLQVYKEAFVHKKTNLFKYDSLKRRVFLATTHEEVSSVIW